MKHTAKPHALRHALLAIFSAALLFALAAAPALAQEEDSLRGVWIATVYSIDFPHTSTVAGQKQELCDILDTAQAAGLNAVFFQVRPTGDAYYQSSIYPWAKSLTGTAGKNPGWDPLAYLIQEADTRGMEVHAWINPYRLTQGSVASPDTDVSALPLGHPVRENPSLAVAYDDGKLYLDPGNPEAVDLVVEGVKELVQNYDIAGIHFDDYFYPSPTVTKNGKSYTATFDDAATYAKYGGSLSLADWRRANTRELVSRVSMAVKEIDPNCAFGIAPSGIWRNAKNDAQGSDTNGFESYSSIYADTRGWVKDGLLDYICPQIYWTIGQSGSDYEVLSKWWSNVCRGTGVELYIGHAAYQVGETTRWQDAQEIPRQIALNRSLGNVTGEVFYGYSKIKANTLGLADALRTLYVDGGSGVTPPAAASNAPKASGLIIAAPANGSSTTNAKSFIIGAGVPGEPIYVNGQEIERTSSGYFCMYVSLDMGANTFTFEHQGKTTTYTINRKATSSGGGISYALNSAAFVDGTLFPTANSRYAPGETFTLTCVAPQGASVSASLNGTVYALQPERVMSTAGSVASQKYTATVTMRTQNGRGLIDMGKPVYTFVYDGKTVSKTAPYSVFCYMVDNQLVGTITADGTIMRNSNSSSAARKTSLSKGACDYIIWETDTYYQFRYGGWTLKENVATSRQMLPVNLVTTVTGFATSRTTTIQWKLPVFPTYTVRELDDAFEVTFYNTSDTRSRVFTASNPLFQNITCRQVGDNVVYTFTYKPGATLYGFTFSYNGGYLTLAFRNPPSLASGAKPLTGKTILIDPGHGGSDAGATGPLGSRGDMEKDLNLRVALAVRDQLEQLGAAVILTRDSDDSVTLAERTAAIRATRPVVAVSLHHNSVDYVTNVGACYGTVTLYSEDFSAPFAKAMQQAVTSATGAYSRGTSMQGLAVCRVYECPSILVELGFITNPNEYESLASDHYIATEAKGVADGIVAYLRGN